MFTTTFLGPLYVLYITVDKWIFWKSHFYSLCYLFLNVCSIEMFLCQAHVGASVLILNEEVKINFSFMLMDFLFGNAYVRLCLSA